MGKILNQTNLESYLKNPQQPWAPDSLLYECFPVLVVRNYLTSEEEEDEFPLLWTPGRHLQVGVAAAIAVLKGWKAFRPKTAEEIRPVLEKRVPGVVMNFQRRMSDLGVYRIQDVRKKKKEANTTLLEMAAAVSEVSRCKPGKTPMLGSKILHLFYPEFFPVWDTAVVERALKPCQSWDEMVLSDNVKRSLARRDGSIGALTYAAYIQLMLRDLDETGDEEYESLKQAFVAH